MNSDMTLPSDDELEQTFALLQTALASLPHVALTSDRPPASVLDGAKWVHDWVNMDAELAELTNDSQDNNTFAAVRSSTPL